MDMKSSVQISNYVKININNDKQIALWKNENSCDTTVEVVWHLSFIY